ncbi:HAD family hydrolase [Neobacillus dielmonensis]|uniref:HAD family hydrolase n=1 Tax=Neobacillus dielmonensis TaxID=1347369 RepID=UPI000A9D589A|nr:HAD hydrolase family protein [Neobacillus dielmonensis]
MKKAIFIDVDGTLVNQNGVVPESAKFAVQKARENGHLVFICTGRSKAILFPEILEVGFDGVIGSAGGYIEMRDQILFHERVKKEDLQHALDFFNQHGIDFNLEANEGIFAGRNSKKRMRDLIEKLVMEKPEAKEEIEKGFSAIL